MQVRAAALAVALVLCVQLACVAATQSSEGGYKAPKPSGSVAFLDTFDHDGSSWVQSKNAKYQDGVSHVKVDVPEKFTAIPGDKALILSAPAKHYGLTHKLATPFTITDKPLVFQYEVQLQSGLECGGAYIKLLSASDNFDATTMSNDSPYTIMFGPDKCGYGNDKVHFILRHKNPITGEFEEKHMTNPPKTKGDKASHLYTLIVRPDNTFEVKVDQKTEREGSLLSATDFAPPVNPPKEIDDPTDSKPSDWIDDPQMPDPTDSKPADWDESAPRYIDDPEDVKPADWLDNEAETISDPSAQKPADWDDEMDGEYIAPEIPNPLCEEHGCGEWKPQQIANPAYKGKWKPQLIDNPDYKGVWKARQIPNPKYFEDLTPYKITPIGAVAVEIWTMTAGITIDNVLLADSEAVAADFADKTFGVRAPVQAALVEAEKAAEGAAGGSTLDKIRDGFLSTLEALQSNPVIMGAALFSVIVPFLTCYFCWPTSDRAPDAPREPRAAPVHTETTTATEATATTTDAAPAATEATSRAGKKAPATSASPKAKSKAAAKAKRDD